jgi:hypothetical protein
MQPVPFYDVIFYVMDKHALGNQQKRAGRREVADRKKYFFVALFTGIDHIHNQPG